jgi:hypothetical protein
MATIADTNLDGNDETAFVADFQGGIQKITFTASAFSSSAQAYTMSTSANGCGAGMACQPIGASPSLVALAGGGVGVIVITGGSDVARSFPNTDFYVGGFNSATNAQLFAPRSNGALATLPVGAVPATGFPLRGYAPVLISGTSAFADATTLAVNNLSQLILPILVPGQYGDVRRWDTINATPTSVGSVLPAGNTFAGGYGSVSVYNTGTGGSVIAVSNSQGSTLTLAANDTGLANAAYHVGLGAGVTGRNFTSPAWFDLSN